MSHRIFFRPYIDTFRLFRQIFIHSPFFSDNGAGTMGILCPFGKGKHQTTKNFRRYCCKRLLPYQHFISKQGDTGNISYHSRSPVFPHLHH